VVSVGVNQFLTVLHSPKTFTIASVIPSAPSAQPTLGVNWPTNGGGFGQVEPSLVSNGGDATSVVTGITWQSWGGPEATGKGLSAYLPPGAASAAEEFQEPVTIVAFNLDNCAGVPAYTSVEWYFPEYGQSFNPSQGESICTNPFGTPTSVRPPPHQCPLQAPVQLRRRSMPLGSHRPGLKPPLRVGDGILPHPVLGELGSCNGRWKW